MMKKVKILLAPTATLATSVPQPEHTVEAEYGNMVVKGSVNTLAHHVPEYKHYPCPCVATVPLKANESNTILVSHIDLDTIGGVAEILGQKPLVTIGFWELAAKCDIQGPHRVEATPELVAYWYLVSKEPFVRYTDVTDVTDKLLWWIGQLDQLTDTKLQKEAMVWYSTKQAAIEACFVSSNKIARLFNANVQGCSAAYRDPDGVLHRATVVYNTKTKGVTLAFEDSGKETAADKTMQKLFGADAGGHAGIAGTPRGKEFTIEDAQKVMAYLVTN